MVLKKETLVYIYYNILFFMNLKDNLSVLNSFFQIFMTGLVKKKI